MFFSKKNEKKLFIIGKEKSGTTVLAKLVSYGTGLSLATDTPPIWGIQEKAIYEGKISFNEFVKINKSYFKRSIIKEPALTYFFPEVINQYPDAKFVYIIRNPLDNVKSIFSRLKISGDISNFKDIEWSEIPEVWHNVLKGTDFSINGTNPIEVAAERWNRSISPYLEYKNHFVLMKYEDFKQKKEESIKALCDNLDLKIRYKIEDYLNINFQPKSSIENSRKFFSEINYNKILDLTEKQRQLFDY